MLTGKILTKLWIMLGLDVVAGSILSVAILYGHGFLLTLVYMWVTRVFYIFIIVNGIRKDKLALEARVEYLDYELDELFDKYKDTRKHRRRRKE